MMGWGCGVKFEGLDGRVYILVTVHRRHPLPSESLKTGWPRSQTTDPAAANMEVSVPTVEGHSIPTLEGHSIPCYRNTSKVSARE